MPDYYKTARNFWTSRTNYPNYPHVLHRRLIDANYVAERTYSLSSILDLGCGDGSLLLSIREFTQIKIFYGYDISPNMLRLLKVKWGNYPGLTTRVTDFITEILPEADVTTALGSFNYVFEDDQLCSVLHKINSKLLIARASCTLKKENELINTYSEDLQSEYAAIYRTVGNLVAILNEHFFITEIHRAYSDEIESNYGTKHFFFVCKKK